jgi:probable HAF family extracellular repeat protein
MIHHCQLADIPACQLKSPFRAHYRHSVFAIDGVADSLFYEIEVFGLPGQGQMMAYDINNHNDVVGRVDIVDPNSGSIKPTGFLRDGGFVTLIDVPGSGPLNGTQARGINDAGQIVGRFVSEEGSTVTHGFILDNGIITPLDAPTSRDTPANDINNAGVIAGRAFVQPQTGFGSGSAFTLEGGEYSFFRPAEARGSFGISFFGSNDLGSVVGRVFDDTGFRAFAIIDGVYTPFTIPGDSFGGTEAWGINNQNQIVGTFRTGIESHGFHMDETGVYQIDVPGAGSRGLFIYGLNDIGSLVGPTTLHPWLLPDESTEVDLAW